MNEIKKYSLGIVQNKATQFDGPLYRRLAAQPDIELTIYYYAQPPREAYFDPELNRCSGWDHDVLSDYRAVFSQSGIGSQCSLVRRILNAGHDLVIVSGYTNLVPLLTAIGGKMRGIRVGLRSDNVFLYRNKSSWKWKMKDRLYPLVFRLYTTGHPVGTLANEYLLRYGFSADRLFRFPYNVDNEYLARLCGEHRQQRDSIRAEMKIPTDVPVVLGILKFHPREDPLTLLAGFAESLSNLPQAHLVMVGDGPLRKEIEEFIRQRQLNQVHLPGYVAYSELPRYFALSDVFAHPARRECWGVSVNEALACGVPVIIADTVGSGRDLVASPMNTGLYFRSGDPHSLAQVLVEMLQDKKGQLLRERCSTNATRVMEEWDYGHTIASLRKALQYARGERNGC